MAFLHNIDKELCGSILKVVSTVTCGLHTGCALYVTTVENPARMTHDPQTAIASWKPSFVRAGSLLSKLGFVSSLSMFGVYGCLPEDSHRMNWLIAGTTMIAAIPYTFLFIQPLNSQLVETEKCISVKGDDWIVDNLNYWSRLHSVRLLIDLTAFGLVVYTLVNFDHLIEGQFIRRTPYANWFKK